LKLQSIINFLDSDYFPEGAEAVKSQPPKFRKAGLTSFIFVHAVCLGVFFVGVSPIAFWMAVALYIGRMFAVTGFYHRYFSHRTFKTSRAGQLFIALWGLTAVQRGPLWWAAHHRVHHQMSDTDLDPHSAKVRGFWYSHMGWITSYSNMPTDYAKIPDLAKYPELVFLNRFDWSIPIGATFGVWVVGEILKVNAPQLHTNGWQLVVWAFISTAFLYHGTFFINSLSHIWGTRRFETGDESKNNFLLALITLGEGWHNNHHRYPGIARQGLVWWEVDFTYYGLKLMEKLGIIWDVRRNPIESSAGRIDELLAADKRETAERLASQKIADEMQAAEMQAEEKQPVLQ